ncbi:PAS domain-containing protein [Rhodobacter sphaeroides]|uniref:PAS domain-containing protein n=1 Tax=Cereibacter sphaeroides TaxID=1063 RepID=UPI00132C73B9|nr:PAS domain-containing protein [Cereibacter sphaeroides]MWP37074.1 PAS domain-containing protein [Cereibacter sphaeroides]
MAQGTVEARHGALDEAALGIGRWRWDLRSQELVWSEEERAIFGLAPGAPVPGFAAFSAMIHPDDRARVVAAVSETLAQRRLRHSIGFRILRPDGTMRQILSHGRLVMGLDGKPISLEGVDLDLTDTQADPALERPQRAPCPDRTPHIAALRPGEEQDALLRVALEAGRMTVWQLDLQKRLVQVDGDVARLIGLSHVPPELPVAVFENHVDPEDLPLLRAAEAAALRGEPMQVELRLVLETGGRRWLRLMGEPRPDAMGRPQRLVGVAYDISARKEAEEKLRESEAHYRAVFATIDEGFCTCEMIVDETGAPVDYRFLEANPLFESMTGLVNAVGRTALELVPNLERHWIEIYARVGLGGETLRFELPSDAMGRWFNVFAAPLAAPGRFALVFKDVTDRRRSEEALRESEAMFRSLTEAMPQLVWSARPDGSCDFFNRRWTDCTGASTEMAMGDGWRAFYHPDDQPAIDRLWPQALRTGEPYEIEYRLRHRDGSYRWMLGRGVPVRDEAGGILRWMGTCTDIHDLKLAHQRQQILLGEMEHRVKNILALVQAVARQTFGRIPEASSALEAYGGRLQSLAGAYSHLNHESWERASLRHIVATSIGGCGARAETWSLDGPEVMLPPRSAVPVSMAVHELCTNAVKYGALSVPEGRVTIHWSLGPGDRLTLVWAEADGPHVVPPARAGFGMRMIETVLAVEAGGTVRLDFRPEGVRCEIEVPIRPEPGLRVE